MCYNGTVTMTIPPLPTRTPISPDHPFHNTFSELRVAYDTAHWKPRGTEIIFSSNVATPSVSSANEKKCYWRDPLPRQRTGSGADRCGGGPVEFGAVSSVRRWTATGPTGTGIIGEFGAEVDRNRPNCATGVFARHRAEFLRRLADRRQVVENDAEVVEVAH